MSSPATAPPTGAPRRRGWVGRTLRRRLTASLVLVLLVACALTGVATALFLRAFLVGRLDDQLEAAGARFAVSLEHGYFAPAGGDGDADDAVPGQSVGTLGARLVHGRVTHAAVVHEDGKSREPDLTRADRAALAAVPVGGRARSIDFAHGGDYRVQAITGEDGDVLVTGLPARGVDDTLAKLVTIEVALFTVVVTASGVATTLAVRHTLRPLEHVASTALHVSELPLTDVATPLPTGLAPAHPTSEVDQVSVAFDRMLDHVRTALDARDTTEKQLRRFVADASHELRTPLATIRAYAEYGARGQHDLPQPTATALQRIDAAAGRMASLVDDLLLLARLDAGRPLAREDVDLSQLLVESVVDARTAAPDHGWRLDLPDEPVDVVGDGERVHQVLVNLLSNASRHTPAGTTVVTGLRVDGPDVEVTVTDDGPGIPPELVGGLFDRFTRGDPARSAQSGTTGSSGLGLAIAAGIAAAHEGTLDVASRPGRTCFRLRLPRGEPTAGPREREAEEEEPADAAGEGGAGGAPEPAGSTPGLR